MNGLTSRRARANHRSLLQLPPPPRSADSSRKCSGGIGVSWTACAVEPTDISVDFPPHVLVLGPECLRQIHPARALAWLRAGRRTLLVCGSHLPTSDLERWMPLLETRCVDPARLGEVLDDVVRRHSEGGVRRLLEPGDWLPAPPQGRHADFVLRAAALLTRLTPVHDIRLWSSLAGAEYSTFWRRVKLATGLSPSRLALEYVLAYWTHARNAGDSATDIAACLGYSDASALGHALCRARSRPGRPADAERTG